MTKAKHTPGPWVIGTSEGRVLSRWDGIGYWEIANATVTDFRGDSGEVYFAGGAQEANARLIAAAPDLLEALEAMVADWGKLASVVKPLGEESSLRKARAAIAKAKGE